MLTFYDSRNNPYILGEQIGRGGEGAVFSLNEDTSVVAKIYHAPIEDEKAEKLRWMAEHTDKKLLRVAAWVIDVLRDRPDGKVIGFLMPNVRAKEIHELYSLKSRRIYFPDATWHFLVHTSANVARAFYSLHRNNHVMGDVNHGNCVVLADGTVKLIDCDSYSIKTDKLRYRCDVGVATHLAPELQKADLGEVEREANHDNFGLAVIIFQLLFLGRHPFAGNYTGAEDKSLEDCIAEYRFAYGKNAGNFDVKQPPGTLSLNQVSPRVAELFERAFSTEIVNRPEPREWIEALEDLSDNLEQCSFHPGHHYFNGLAGCPWCEIEAQTGVMLFPFVGSSKSADGEQAINIFTVENLIANLGVSTNLPARPLRQQILPPPSAGLIESSRTNSNRQIAIVAGHFLLLTLLMAAFGVGISCFIGFLLMAVFIVAVNSTDRNLRGRLNDRLISAKSEWERIENEWEQALLPKKFNDDLGLIKTKISDYRKVQLSGVRQLKSLDETAHRRAFENHVQTLKLNAATIPGVEKIHINLLEDKGIKTAADLDEEKLDSVFLFHKDVKENLLQWRDDVEKKFHDEREPKISEEEKTGFKRQVAEKRRVIEKEIEYLFGNLRAGSVMIRRKQQELVVKSEQTAVELAQAESDVEALGNSSIAVLALLLITFLMPFIGILFSEVNSSRSTYPPPATSGRGYETRPGSGMSSGIREAPMSDIQTAPAPNTYDSEAEKLYVPPETLTEKEIRVLPDETKWTYSVVLRRQAANAVFNKDYIAAERKLRFALRFNPMDPAILNPLAFALYNQGKYSESLGFLSNSSVLLPDNSDTKIYQAMNYLQLKKYDQARDVAEQVIAKYPSHFEAHFNLGLAYIGLKDFASAEKAFRHAIKLSPNDADSHYELGYVLAKLGRNAEARSEHQILLALDPALAQKLLDDANLRGRKATARKRAG